MQLHDKNNITENKLIVLYMLKKFNAPLSFDYMYEYLSSKDWMNYFDMGEIMIELEDAGFIKKDGNIFEITIEGAGVLESFRRRIPFSIRCEIENHAFIYRTPAIRETQITADYEQDSKNEFPVTLEIYENKVKVFSMKLTATSGSEARQLCDAFRKNADSIYSSAVSMLAQDIIEQ